MRGCCSQCLGPLPPFSKVLIKIIICFARIKLIILKLSKWMSKWDEERVAMNRPARMLEDLTEGSNEHLTRRRRKHRFIGHLQRQSYINRPSQHQRLNYDNKNVWNVMKWVPGWCHLTAKIYTFTLWWDVINFQAVIIIFETVIRRQHRHCFMQQQRRNPLSVDNAHSNTHITHISWSSSPSP